MDARLLHAICVIGDLDRTATHAKGVWTMQWRPPPATGSDNDHRVDIWRVQLDLPGNAVARLGHILSPDEQLRVAQFRLPRDARRFITARGIRRLILARYLHISPEQVSFAVGPHGKPALPRMHGWHELRFNVTHSHNTALVAVGWRREVGIDIEYMRSDFDWTEIARRYFSPGERAAIRSTPDGARTKAFFTYWTCKEAYVKARGEGLTRPLDQYEVVWPSDTAPRLHLRDHAVHDGTEWSLRILDPGPDFTAAVVGEGDDWEVCCWQWPETLMQDIPR